MTHWCEMKACRPVAWALFGALIWLSSAPDARAEIRISGTKEAALLDAKDASLGDILSALNAKFNIRIRLVAPVERTVAGTYSGSVRHLLSRILDGSDYVITFSDDLTSATILVPNAKGVIARASAFPADAKLSQPLSPKVTDDDVPVRSERWGW